MNIDPLFLPALDLLLKSMCILTVAFTIQHFWSKASAATLNTVWLMTFGALLLLPFTRMAQPRWATSLTVRETVRILALPVSLPDVAAGNDSEEEVTTPVPDSLALPEASQLLACVWGLGAAFVVIRRMIGTWQLHRIKKQSASLFQESAGRLASRLAREWGVTRSVELRESNKVPVPLTWGTLHPLIMLPQGAGQWEEERLMAALQHELGHIKRYDVLTRGLTDLVCAIYWINPLVWLGAKAMRLTQERACDDLVLNTGVSAENYATQLLESARLVQHPSTHHLPALAMAQPSTLEIRLLAIVDEEQDRRPVSWKSPLFASLSGITLLILSATMQLRAQNLSPADDPSNRFQQIHISVKIIEATDGTLKNALQGLAPGKALSRAQAAIIMERITETPNSDILSSPSVTTRSGQQAKVEIGREYIWDGSERVKAFLGTSVSFLPILTDKGEIKLKADAVTRKLVSEEPKPVFRESEIDSEILLQQGQTVIMTGAPAGENGRENLFLISAHLVDASGIKVTPAEPEMRPTVEAKARKIVFPSIVFQNASLQEAVDFLRIKSKEYDAEKKGINVVINVPQEALNVTLSLNVNDVPLSAALSYVAQLSSLKLVFNESACVLEPIGAKAAVSMGTGASSPMEVTVASKSAEKIIIPHLEFAEATVSEAVEFLRAMSLRHDPEKKGVNLILKRSKAWDEPGSAEPVLSLSLREVPLTEALRYVAELANLKLSAQADAYLLSPLEKTTKSSTGASAPMGLKADSVTTTNSLLQASGNVTVTLGKLTINADHWEADSDKQTGIARGNLEIIQESDTRQSTITAKEGEVEVNLKDGTLKMKGKHKVTVKAK